MDLFAAIARNKRKTVILTAWAATTLAVVAWRASHYASAPTVLVPIARGSAAGVYLNSMLILLPMMRLLLSRPSLSALRLLLPVHKAIEAHVIAGWALLSFSAVHVAAYLGLFLTERELFSAVATPLPLWTGVALTGLFAALAWGGWVRDAGRFEAFYYTHFLTVPIGVLCLLHAPWFPALVSVPLGLYLADRLARVAWMTRAARVEHVSVDGRDLDLVVHRPDHFEYRSGDYAFLCVPAVSRLQWHPFSLINAPSDRGDLSFRIRRYGAWTAALTEVPPGATVYIDGPFASPCRDLHDTARAVVVAGGIGITPFVSFLEEVRATAVFRFERMHLYWFEKDEASFSRFHDLLDELERALDGALTVTLVTSNPRPSPSRLVTSRRVDWDQELGGLRDAGLDGATVFFCGPKPMSRALRRSTRRAGFKFRTESF